MVVVLVMRGTDAATQPFQVGPHCLGADFQVERCRRPLFHFFFFCVCVCVCVCACAPFAMLLPTRNMICTGSQNSGVIPLVARNLRIQKVGEDDINDDADAALGDDDD